MSDEHMAMAREVTRDWTPQTTLADSRRDIATALAAAEERGRRAGIEERDALRSALGVLLDSVDYTSGACTVTEMVGAVLPMVVIVRARAALAPRDSGTCGADEDGIHREARKDRK